MVGRLIYAQVPPLGLLAAGRLNLREEVSTTLTPCRLLDMGPAEGPQVPPLLTSLIPEEGRENEEELAGRLNSMVGGSMESKRSTLAGMETVGIALETVGIYVAGVLAWSR